MQKLNFTIKALPDSGWRIVFCNLQFLFNCGLTNKAAECVVADRIEAKANQVLKTLKIKLKQREPLDHLVIKSQGVGGISITLPGSQEKGFDCG